MSTRINSKPKVTVIIPVYNEERSINDCLKSLLKQSYDNIEIIVVDDGSNDKTMNFVKKFPIKLITQKHQGPGPARNLAAQKSTGEILILVDGDMTFDKNFISKLTEPIREGRVIGTFSKEEYVSNAGNIWSKCWNINRAVPANRMHPENYPDHQPVFRAIRKDKFLEVSGFDPVGYTDDWTLARKLKTEAQAAPGAVFYHRNPDNLMEIWEQARWIGKNEFITGSLLRKLWSLWVYGLLNSLRKAIQLSVLKKEPQFFVFKIWYDLAVFTSTVLSFIGEKKAK